MEGPPARHHGQCRRRDLPGSTGDRGVPARLVRVHRDGQRPRPVLGQRAQQRPGRCRRPVRGLLPAARGPPVRRAVVDHRPGQWRSPARRLPGPPGLRGHGVPADWGPRPDRRGCDRRPARQWQPAADLRRAAARRLAAPDRGRGSEAEMTAVIPVEADWERAPGLLDGAANLELTVDQCDLAYWFSAVAQGTLKDRPLGYSAAEVTPDFLREPGPLREALRLELAYRSLDEEAAVRVLAYYVAAAPDIPHLEFFSTQMMDEARHHMIFRNHLLNLGLPQGGLMDWIRRTGADYQRVVLNPVRDFAISLVRDEQDFVGAVVAFAIIIEGILAASTELSERKWSVLDPVAGEI